MQNVAEILSRSTKEHYSVRVMSILNNSKLVHHISFVRLVHCSANFLYSVRIGMITHE